MPTKKIKVTKEQKKTLQPVLAEIEIARAAFKEASRMLEISRIDLNDKLLEMFSSSVCLHYPPKGEWTVEILK